MSFASFGAEPLFIATHLVAELFEDIRAMLSKELNILGQLFVNTLADAVYGLVFLLVSWVAFSSNVITIRLGHEGAIASHRIGFLAHHT